MTYYHVHYNPARPGNPYRVEIWDNKEWGWDCDCGDYHCISIDTDIERQVNLAATLNDNVPD